MARYGLVIGNAAYGKDPLKNAVNDARSIHKALQMRGFESFLLCDATKDQIIEAIVKVKDKVVSGDLLFVYFAGHAYEHLGYGYLVPIDIDEFTPASVEYCSYHLEDLLRETQGLGLVRIVVLDACRLPFNAKDYSSKAVNERIHEARSETEKSQSNVLVSYSTSYGDVALDGMGSNSVFTKHLKRALLDHKLSVEEMFKDIGSAVIHETKNRQRPWFYSSLVSKIKISDLPNFKQQQSFFANAGGCLNALVVSKHRDGVFFVSDNKYLQLLADSGANGKLRFETGVRAIRQSEAGDLFAITNEGKLLVVSIGLEVDLKEIDPEGVAVSGDGEFIFVYGLHHCVMFRKQDEGLHLVYEKRIKKSFYCAEFISNTEVWVGGDYFSVLSVRIISDKVSARHLELKLLDHLYAICKHDDNHVILATSSGNIYMINREAEISGLVMNLGESPRLPSSRRSSLLHVVGDDQIINEFLFAPKGLDESAVKLMKERLGSNDLLYISRSNTLPILAIGSSEGVVTIIDTRVWEAYQQLDTSGGRETELVGLAFTAKNTLVAATKDKHILFYAPIRQDYFESLDYVDSL
ncbi:caspase family protein [Pseudomonas sp. CBC3]|uniref:caspase family protein n=1 Tax=Pseudomonas sp. CBC3 TaxID=3123318 RepID=UPI0030E7AB08